MAVTSPRHCELSVIIPAYNEGTHIRDAVSEIMNWVRKVTSDFEVLVIDDGSQDDTWPEILSLKSESGVVRGIRLARNFGKDAALAAGLKHCRGRGCLILDADLQHPPSLIPILYECWKRDGVQIVNGVKRQREKESLFRRACSVCFNGLASWMTGINFDNSSDFKLLDRAVIDAWLLLPERRVFFRGLVSWVGFRSKDIEFDVQARARGRSKWTIRSLVNLAWKCITAYSILPLRLIHLISALFIVFAIALGGRTVYLRMVGRAVDGFATVIMVVLVVGGLVLMSLGIIAEYLAAVYDEVKNRPRYIISDVSSEQPDHVLSAAAFESR